MHRKANYCVILATMTLHIFNPEHDIALAKNIYRFTPPKAGRGLREDLDFLPALWAQADDCVLVGDELTAHRHVEDLQWEAENIHFVSTKNITKLLKDNVINAIAPWGWDRSIAFELQKMGLQIPYNSQQLDELRRVSSRQWSADHLVSPLQQLDDRIFCGAHYYNNADEALECLRRELPCVAKAPWSSSGRGVRFFRQPSHISQQSSWVRSVVSAQGGILVEPFCDNKIADFGMEFTALPHGGVRYDGLSLFSADHGQYTGNLVASETTKRQWLSQWMDDRLLDAVSAHLCDELTRLLPPFYAGPLGVDMLLFRREDRVWLNPCIELNLRNTMGHVALHLFQRQPSAAPHRMQIRFDGQHYHFLLASAQL